MSNLKNQLILLVFLVIGLSFNFCSFKESTEVRCNQPNIILIMADDMGFSDPGFMGSGINTPNIDRLANNGMVFNQFYNAGRCCPTRASLLTGLYAHNANLGWMTASDFGRDGYRGAISKNTVTIAEVLGQAGYANYLTGKWHVTYDGDMEADSENSNWPMQRGFDKFYGMLAGGGGYYKPTTLTYGNKRIQPHDGFYLTEAINDSTISFLTDHLDKKKEQPFFFYVAYYAPHRPLHALEEDIKKYKGEFSQGWDHFRKQRFETMKAKGIANDGWALSERPKDIPEWTSLSAKEKAMWETRMEVYAAQIDRMDQGVGDVISLLEERNELDNTVILFLSDNGACAEPQGKDFDAKTIQGVGSNSFNQSYRKHWANMSNSPFRLYKSSNHEGGISTPLIVHWPKKITKSSISSHQGHVIDLLATFIDLAGATYPENFNGNTIKPLQGASFKNALFGDDFQRKPMYFEHQADRAIIDRQWKLVATKSKKPPYTGKWRLHDLSKDRAECNDLSSEYPNVALALKKKWNQWAFENNVLPLDGRGWNERVKTDVNSTK